MTAVILDTDIGTDIDDTWALAMLLGSPELDLRLVVTASGDTAYRARVAAGILSAGGRDDVPIALGIPTTLDTNLPPTPQGRFAAGVTLAHYRGGVLDDGVAALIDCVMRSDEPVTIIAIGPMTNIAAALDLEPAIVENSRLVAMLGSVHRGMPSEAATGPVPEYNVTSDVSACRAVLAATWEKTITPLDTCGFIVLRDRHYRAVRTTGNPLTKVVLRNYEEWFETFCDAGDSWADAFDRLDRELGTTSTAPTSDEARFCERSSSILFDTAAIYLAYDESFLNIERLPIGLAEDGLMSITPGAPELRVATSWRDRDAFMDHLVERLTTGPRAARTSTTSG